MTFSFWRIVQHNSITHARFKCIFFQKHYFYGRMLNAIKFRVCFCFHVVHLNKNIIPKAASRAQILNKATDYINYMRRKNHSHQTDIEDLKQQNVVLDQQVHNMEKQRNSGLFNTDAASALISTTDTLLNTSPLPSDPLLDIKEPDSGTLDPFVNIDSVDGDANTEEYTTPSKRIKTDV
ncbi:max-like isoform X2 [Paramuricea clavata]|uniref:Max-like isoform X2 n=1 Tax=Paramuricea clavata TaxID=317549 RepID=A0A6S7IML2_PARCT|nr:max-like isoform X2 [Paramuricea clavata]